MVGRGFLSLLGAAVVLGFSAPGALADEGQRLVMVEHSPFMIQQLESKGYDVGFIGEKYEAAVFMDAAERGEAAGRRLQDRPGRSRTTNTRLDRKAEIAATTQSEALASEFARKGIPASGVKRNGKSIVAVPGNLVIMRAYTFTNYAGRFLYVEAHNKAHTDNTGPAMAMSFAGADGVFRNSTSMSNGSVSPDGGDAGHRRQQGRRRRRRQQPLHVPPHARRPARRRRQPGAAADLVDHGSRR